MIASARSAKARLSELLERAAAGEEIVITVAGRPKAKLMGLSERARPPVPGASDEVERRRRAGSVGRRRVKVPAFNGRDHDILEARVEGKKITLTPKSRVDREIAPLALEDVRKGRVVGPFSSASAMLADLHKRVAREKRKRRENRLMQRARVTKGWRFYFQIEDDTYTILSVRA